MNLAAKYRPRRLADVVGQDVVVAALASSTAQSFLFDGPSGVGKTTLARIVAADRGCDEVVEIDAATHTGVEAMRGVIASTATYSLSGTARAYIVDECHRLSKQAWDSMLKVVEEPPADVLWMFCTTEPAKVPRTIVTRCQRYSLAALSHDTLCRLVKAVSNAERLDITAARVALVARAARGSARAALVGLEAVASIDSDLDAERLLREASATPEAVELARVVATDAIDMVAVKRILSAMREAKMDAESVRVVVFAYLTSVALSNNGGFWVNHALGAFETPCVEQNGIGDLYLKCARLAHKKG